MTSVIKVDNIQSSGGTAALSIDSSGRVTMANTTQIDMWRLNASFGTNGATITGWEQPDSSWEATVGSSMSESSGIFTFPNTGLYRISGTFFLALVSGDTSAAVLLYVSTDSGSNYDIAAQCVESYGTNTSAAFQTLMNVTDASTFRVKLVTSGLNSGGNVVGNTAYNASSVMFERVAPAQQDNDMALSKITNSGIGTIDDITVSGGLYVGGTGSANYLEDYEEGTWTPSVSATYGFTAGASPVYSGNYVKVGDLIHVNCSLDFDSSETLALGDRFIIQGLPFTMTGSKNGVGGGSFIQPGSFSSGTHAVGTVASNSQSQDEIMCVVTRVNGTPPALNNTNVNCGITYRLTNTFS